MPMTNSSSSTPISANSPISASFATSPRPRAEHDAGNDITDDRRLAQARKDQSAQQGDDGNNGEGDQLFVGRHGGP